MWLSDRVDLEIADHRRDFRIGDAVGAPAGRHVVIGDAERELWLGDASVRALSSG